MSDRGVTTSTNVLACFIHPKYSFFFFFSVFPSREISMCKKETKAINVGKFFQKETQTPKNTLKNWLRVARSLSGTGSSWITFPSTFYSLLGKERWLRLDEKLLKYLLEIMHISVILISNIISWIWIQKEYTPIQHTRLTRLIWARNWMC